VSWLDTMRRWARSAPLPDGPMRNGTAEEALGAEDVIILAFDSNGRVSQILGGQLANGTVLQVAAGRSEVLKLLDTFDIQDQPEYPR